LTLLNPHWLFAASAIFIPIAIHLWNKRQGKTIKVGSLRWLEASASKQWSSIKLNNILLLLLRCLILLLLAIALAQPVWQHKAQSPQSSKAVIISEEVLYSKALSSIKPTVDSLVNKGYALHLFTPKLEQIPQTDWGNIRDSLVTAKTNYWSLLPILSEKFNHPQDSIVLFTSDQQQYFSGTRPVLLPKHIRWIPIAIEDNTTWLQAAIRTAPDSLLVMLGHSSREGSTYSKHLIISRAQEINFNNQRIQLQHNPDTLFATIAKHKSKIAIQKEPVQIALISDESHQEEVRYLKAAIKAIRNYTGVPINISADTTNGNWLFWLHNEEVPKSVTQKVKKGLNVWVQQSQKPKAVKAHLTSSGNTTFKIHNISALEQPKASYPLLTTVNGEDVLTYKPIGKGNIYTFRSGFGPTWSDLGQSAQLPELLLPLLLKQQVPQFDFRAIDESILKTTSQPKLEANDKPKSSANHISKWFVLAAFALFLLERTLANKRSNL
jgi:hypothetical protein